MLIFKTGNFQFDPVIERYHQRADNDVGGGISGRRRFNRTELGGIRRVCERDHGTHVFQIQKIKIGTVRS